MEYMTAKTPPPFSKTGIYMRLSHDDDKACESSSIENQRIILRKYVAERGGTVIAEYVDDGLSGTNFNRPGVKRMLGDAQAGKIDTIVVKDLSRFGRNYIQVGQYIDYIFPAYGIRFVAVNDNIDTVDRGSAAMDMMPIMNVFNEWHAANTSKKIRAVLEAKQRSGIYTNWNYAYGYNVSSDENRTAVVDAEAAQVVRKIFALRSEGKSARAIAKILTDEKIPNPTNHFRRLDGGKWNRPCKPYWCPSTVSGILSDPIYIGVTVQHKTTSVSYKNHKTVKIPEAERIVNENSHEAIISVELWNSVQQMKNSVSRGRTDKSDVVHPLSGLLICPDCGKKFKLKRSEKKYADSDVRKNYFCCRTYADLGKNYCSSHNISEREMESIVSGDIREMLSGHETDESAAREKFIALKSKSGDRSRCSDQALLKSCEARIAEIDRLIRAAFEDKILKDMSESVFESLCENYRSERYAKEEELRKIKKRLAETASYSDGKEVNEYISRLKSYSDCTILTRELCIQLIEFITVGEKNENGVRDIHIYYRLKKNENSDAERK